MAEVKLGHQPGDQLWSGLTCSHSGTACPGLVLTRNEAVARSWSQVHIPQTDLWLLEVLAATLQVRHRAVPWVTTAGPTRRKTVLSSSISQRLLHMQSRSHLKPCTTLLEKMNPVGFQCPQSSATSWDTSEVTILSSKVWKGLHRPAIHHSWPQKRISCQIMHASAHEQPFHLF